MVHIMRRMGKERMVKRIHESEGEGVGQVRDGMRDALSNRGQDMQ